MVRLRFIFLLPCSSLARRVHRDEDPADGGSAIRKGRAGPGTGDLALVCRQHHQNLL
jgi:hypothetical protein